MSTTTAREQMIHSAQDAAQRLRHLDDLTATVHTFLTIVQDATTYADDSAQTCTEELQRLAGIHHPQHTGTQTYADHIEGFCSQENHGCPACPQPATVDEQMIAVVFDVQAHTREEAAALIHDALALHPGAPFRTAVENAQAHRSARLESWWLPETDVKHVDGNDRRAAMHLVNSDQ